MWLIAWIMHAILFVVFVSSFFSFSFFFFFLLKFDWTANVTKKIRRFLSSILSFFLSFFQICGKTSTIYLPFFCMCVFFLFINWWCLAFYDCVFNMTSSSGLCHTHNIHPTSTRLSSWQFHPKNTKQDYSEEFRDIGGVKGKGKAQLPEGAITLINQRIVTDDLPVISVTPKRAICTNPWLRAFSSFTPQKKKKN